MLYSKKTSNIYVATKCQPNDERTPGGMTFIDSYSRRWKTQIQIEENNTIIYTQMHKWV